MEMKYISNYNSPVGVISLISDGINLTNLYIEKQECFIKKIDRYIMKNDLEIFKKTRQWLDSYFMGDIPDVSLNLKPQGSSFQQEVWQLLLGIPYGSTVTYGDIADMVARRRKIKTMSAQAIGGAVGANPISIIIPCHRVIGKNGNLTGYNGGIELKIKLLEIEGIGTKKNNYLA